MIENYISIDFNGVSTQEDFNNAVRIAVATSKANPSVISKVRIASSDKEDYMELAHAFHEYNEETKSDDFKLEYFTDKMKMVGLETPSDNDTKSYAYVVSWDMVWDFDQIANNNKVFVSKEDALEFFTSLKKDEFESIKDKISDNWVESDGNYYDEESGNATWEFYDNGSFSSNHSCIYLSKKEVE